jgi:hypothetical protein
VVSEVNLQLVREFFELHRFHVLTHWELSRDLAPSTPSLPEAAPRLFITQTSPESGPLPFLLRHGDVPGLSRAVVEVRAWHADRVYASVVEGNPVLGQVASAECRALAENAFASPDFRTLLVISELPASAQARARALQLLEGLGISHVIEFGTILRGLLDMVHPQGQYAPSATLQTLRLLKRYGLIRRQQLDLPFPAEPPIALRAPAVDTSPAMEEEEDSDEA